MKMKTMMMCETLRQAKKRGYLIDLVIEGKIILNLTLNKYFTIAWNGFICLRIGSHGG
jgi:hypothetical protein